MQEPESLNNPRDQFHKEVTDASFFVLVLCFDLHGAAKSVRFLKYWLYSAAVGF